MSRTWFKGRGGQTEICHTTTVAEERTFTFERRTDTGGRTHRQILKRFMETHTKEYNKTLVSLSSSRLESQE